MVVLVQHHEYSPDWQNKGIVDELFDVLMILHQLVSDYRFHDAVVRRI